MDKIIIDAMGGDNAPQATVGGCVQALGKDRNIKLVLMGRGADIEAELKKYDGYDAGRIEIVDCPDVIDMNDVPTEAVRQKRHSSLVEGYWDLKKDDEACALVTAGSTGATIVGGQTILGRIRGVKRAALCPGIPNVRGGVTLLCDCGANAECKPVMLCQFAVLATAYAQAGFGIKNPRVGLLNNGTEEHKGDTLRQETYKYMKQMDCINFVGNVEGRDIMMGDIDIAVSDGFSGNIALKSMEGCGKLVSDVMKKSFKSSLSAMIGYLFARGAVKRMRADLDFEKAGGALLLGLEKVVVKGHGSSNAESFANSILGAANIYRGGLIGKIEDMLAKIDLDSIIPAEI